MAVCFDCKIKLKDRKANRCGSCAQKERFTRMPVWNKGISNTWFNPKGLMIGWAGYQKRFIKGGVAPMKGRKNLKISGKNHWNWTGNPKIERQRLMGQQEYKQWREVVFTRDNWVCRECGQRGGELQADHIKPWAKYPELRYNIKNGRTLCKNCHRKTDTYGWNTLYLESRG